MGNYDPFARLTFWVIFGVAGSMPVVNCVNMGWWTLTGLNLDFATRVLMGMVWMDAVLAYVNTRPPKH